MSSVSTALSTDIDAPELPRWVVTTVQACRAAWRFWAGEAPAAEVTASASACNTSARFRHPHAGQAWDGHGPQPQWLRDAVLCQGYTVEELRQAARRSA